MAENSKKTKYPEPDIFDHVDKTVKAVASLIPPVGLALAFITPPLERRREEFLKTLAEVVNNLNEKFSTLSCDLQQDESFISFVVNAASVALKTHQQEKKQIIKNALFNAGMPNSLEDSKSQIFLDLIDGFTVWHFRVLKLAQDPKTWVSDQKDKSFKNLIETTSYLDMLRLAYPKLDDGFRQLIWRDLYGKGLVVGDDPDSMWTSDKKTFPRTSKLGNEFIEFISEQ